MIKNIGGHLGPFPRSFYPKSPDQNSEIAILFIIVEKPNNYVFGDDLLPNVPGGGAANYKLWPVFTYSNGYWELYRRFQWDLFVWGGRELRRGATWENPSMKEFVTGQENFNEVGAKFSSII